MVGIEPTTPSLPRTCSATELHQRAFKWRKYPFHCMACASQREDTESYGREIVYFTTKPPDVNSFFLKTRRFSQRAHPVGSDGAPFDGAGDGNRTHVIGLEGRGSTIKLRPLIRGGPPQTTIADFGLRISDGVGMG